MRARSARLEDCRSCSAWLAPLNARVGIPFSVAAYGNAHGIETLFVIIPQLSPSSFRR